MLIYDIINTLHRKKWWRQIMIFTVIRCGYPGHLLDGHVIGRSYLFGDVVHYSCRQGYKLDGPKVWNRYLWWAKHWTFPQYLWQLWDPNSKEKCDIIISLRTFWDIQKNFKFIFSVHVPFITLYAFYALF